MYVISLTSIPPRLPRLGRVLDSLLAQRPIPQAVFLCLPRVWSRFDAAEVRFEPPKGVFIHMSDVDFGPSMKAICLANHQHITADRLIYCDDDWIYPQGWAASLLDGGAPHEAVAGSGFNVQRLKRRSHAKPADVVDIAQGYAGVSIDPKWLRGPDVIPPPEAQLADDLWLSGVLARQGVPIRINAAAKEGLRPAFEDRHGLQDLSAPGRSRHEASKSALETLTRRYGLWPPM